MAKAAKTQQTIATVKDLRGMSAADLTTQAAKLRQDMWSARLKLRDGSAQQSHQIRQSRRQIARILTVMKQQAVKNAKDKA